MPRPAPPPPPEAPAAAHLGWALRQRREARALTREQLAPRLGYGVRVIQEVELGCYRSPLVGYLANWDQVFGLDPELRVLWHQTHTGQEHHRQPSACATQGVHLPEVDNGSSTMPLLDKDGLRVLASAQVHDEHPRSAEGLSGRAADSSVDERQQVVAAARHSMGHAAATESAAVGHMTLEQLGDEVIGIARAYPAAPPFPLFGDMLRLRDHTYAFLERTRRPDQLRELYLIAGQLCGLLAGASFDLGHPDAAAEQAHAARAYGEFIGHDELCAWADGMLATCAFWSGRAAAAVALVQRGLATSPPGAPQVGLWCIGARAFAHMDDADNTRAAIRAADQARGRAEGRAELHDRIGGQFAFNDARRAFSNGSALLRIGDVHAAAQECTTAVTLYEREPASRRGYAARADLAATRLLGADLDGAAAVLEPVFSLAPGKRVANVVTRLQTVHGLLARPRYRSARQSVRISEQIAGFVADTALRALPAPER